MHFRGRLPCVEFNMQRIENSFSTVDTTDRLVYDLRPFVYITVTSPAPNLSAAILSMRWTSKFPKIRFYFIFCLISIRSSDRMRSVMTVTLQRADISL